MIARPIAILTLSALATTAAASQTVPRELSLVPDGKMDIAKVGGPRDVFVVAGPGGRTVMVPRAGWGEIVPYDSTGTALPWRVKTGFRDDSEIGYANRAGWISGTNTMWVADLRYSQVVLIDAKGTVTKSIEYPSWVHPTWAQRRAYPVFASMEPYAIYSDQT